MKEILVNVNKAEYQGRPWKSLGDFGKRKYENLLVLKEIGKSEDKINIRYVQMS